MQHLGPEEGQLHGLLVAQPLQAPGPLHQPRVGGEDPVHVGPDLQLGGAQGGGGQGRGQIRAAPAQQHRLPGVVATEEARQQAQGLAPQAEALQALPDPAGHRLGFQGIALAHQHLGRIQLQAGPALGLEQPGQERAGGPFPQSADAGQHLGRAVAQEGHPLEQAGQFPFQRFQALLQREVAGRGQVQGRQGPAVGLAVRVQHRLGALAALGPGHQEVGDAAHGRDHQQHPVPVQGLGGKPGHPAEPRLAGHGSAPEFHHQDVPAPGGGRDGSGNGSCMVHGLP